MEKTILTLSDFRRATADLPEDAVLNVRSAGRDSGVGLRECGRCKLCCYIFRLDGEFWGGVKPGRTWCKYAKGTGCAMHDQPRPDVCTGFKCMWLADETMPESWRPDRSGVLLVSRGEAELGGRYIPIVQVSEQYPGILDKSQFARSVFATRAILMVNYAHEQNTRFRNLPGDKNGAPDEHVMKQILEYVDPGADFKHFAFRQVG